MVRTRVKHEEGGVRLVLSDSANGDVALRLACVQADEFGRALYLGTSADGIRASSADAKPATLSVVGGEVIVAIEGEAPYQFALEGDNARGLGASALARPVRYEVECQDCDRRSWGETTVAPTSEIAEALARSEHGTCPHCGQRVVGGELVGYDDDVWRVPPQAEP